jgi:hypothetical protein
MSAYRAFNKDKPYDLLLKEHLAGDLNRRMINSPQPVTVTVGGLSYWFVYVRRNLGEEGCL